MEDKNKLKTVPVHVGIIMDGNGRWAKARGLPRAAGHREGLKAVRRAVKVADKSGVRYLTLYSFSTENWQRSELEVKFLFSLMENRLMAEGKSLHGRNVRVRFIGSRTELPASLAETMSHIENLTEDNTGLTLVFAINYGGRQEILDAVNVINSKTKSGILCGPVNGEMLERHLYTAGMPAPDLVVRTSGEKRLSNFLLWQSAYAEFYFTRVLWPDFCEEDFMQALVAYARRKRRYGGLGRQ